MLYFGCFNDAAVPQNKNNKRQHLFQQHFLPPCGSPEDNLQLAGALEWKACSEHLSCGEPVRWVPGVPAQRDSPYTQEELVGMRPAQKASSVFCIPKGSPGGREALLWERSPQILYHPPVMGK